MRFVIIVFIVFSTIGCSKSLRLDPVPLDEFYSLNSIICFCESKEIVPYAEQLKLDFENSQAIVRVYSELPNQFIFMEEETYELKLIIRDSLQLLVINDKEFLFQEKEKGVSLISDGPFFDARVEYRFTKN